MWSIFAEYSSWHDKLERIRGALKTAGSSSIASYLFFSLFPSQVKEQPENGRRRKLGRT